MENNTYIAERKKTYICLTIVFNILFFNLKLMTLGWFTIILAPIILQYLILYNTASILTSCIINKTRGDHIRYWCLNSCLILSVLTFCDYGDSGPTAKIIKFLPDNTLLNISTLFFILCTILSIVLIVIFYKKKKKLHKN